MKLKELIFVNTLLVLSYACVNSLSKIEGYNAILLIIIFGLAMVSQLIFATVLKPEKINVLFGAIVLLRLAVFLTVPLQRNIYLYTTSVIITFCLDLWQYSHWKINSVFKTKTYTQKELIYSKTLMEIVLVFSLIISALICHKEMFAMVFLAISFYKLFNMKKSGYRVCIIAECCISAAFIVLKRLNIIDSILLYVLALLLFFSFVVILICSHTYFDMSKKQGKMIFIVITILTCVDKFYETDFKKETPYAPMGSRMFDLTEVLGKEKLPDTKELAN